MGSVNQLLSQRLGKKSKNSKAAALGKNSNDGKLTSFAGLFGQAELSDGEKSNLEEILLRFATREGSIAKDLKALSLVTSEVKAINNQAAILHGERIKRAQEILKNYEDGAFTAWLLSTYGNRQTPYNFLQYYEFHSRLPHNLRPQIEKMPRQAVYALASRQGDMDQKVELVRDYAGETKDQMLHRIRDTFPLADSDQRRVSTGDGIVNQLARLNTQLNRPNTRLTKRQKRSIERLLDSIYARIEDL